MSRYALPNIFIFAILAIVLVCGPYHARAEQETFLDVQTVTSPGGITAWLVEDNTLPLIALEFAFSGAGSAGDPEELQGLAQLASNMLDEGAGPYDAKAFQKELNNRSIGLSFHANRDDFRGSLKTLSRHREQAFDMLSLSLTAPRFPEEALDRMKASNMARIRSSLSDPEWIAARIANDVVYDGHPYARNSGGTLSSLPRITTDDLRTYAQERLAKSNLLVTVVGDITADELGSILDRIFGGLPETAIVPDLAAQDVSHQGQSFIYERDMPQTIMIGALPGISRDDPRYYAFTVMNRIFGAGGFGSRLTEEIREKRGLTYGIHGEPRFLDDVNSYWLQASTNNQTLGEMVEIIKAEMTRMTETPVKDGELSEAIAYLTGSLPLTFTSTGSIARSLLGLRMHDLPPDYYDDYRAKIHAVTAEDVQAIAAEVLIPAALTLILVGQPEGIEPDHKVETLPNAE